MGKRQDAARKREELANGRKKSNGKRKKSMKRGKKILLVCLTILVFVLAGTFGYAVNLLGKIKTKDFNFSKEELGIESNDGNQPDNKGTGEIKNIVLYGIDSFEDTVGRSDAIILATVDTKHNKLKLTSLIRDTYVNIPGHGYDKLNHAFAYGQETLSMKTINQTFGLDVDDYVKVNFTGLEDIIDAVGGLDIEITEDEISDYVSPNMNEHIRHLSQNKGIKPKYITEPGVHHLNGLQTTAYVRIRYTEGGDIKRTERQRHVLNLLFDKVMNAGVLKLPSIISEVLPYVETSLTKSEILSLGTKVLSSGMKDLHQETFPHLDYSEDSMINDIYYRTFDEEETKKQIQDYIYDDIKPKAKTDVTPTE